MRRALALVICTCILLTILLYNLSLKDQTDYVAPRVHYMGVGVWNVMETKTQSPAKATNSSLPIIQKNTKEQKKTKVVTFREALEMTATPDKVVILAMVDTEYVDMSMNFYLTSIVKFNLTNMLFMAVKSGACDQMLALNSNIHCFTYVNDTSSEKGDYMSKAFLGKMNIRTNFVYQALQWGFSILQVDTDIIFMQNPMSSFTCHDCAIESLQDGIKNYINCGFVLIKSSQATIKVYKEMVKRAIDNPLSEDQRNLNDIVHKQSVKYRVLDADEFLSGLDYYERPTRYFADTAKPCPKCIVVHNNWIVSKDAKVYRFREMGQWMFDDDGYYSNPFIKYVTYDNVGKTTFFDTDKNALINALAIAQILNRIVILPKFHCTNNEECALNSRIYINKFSKNFQFREHLFLHHSYVPDSIKSHISDTLTITKVNSTDPATFIPAKPESGASEEEIIYWFGDRPEPVLKFHDLYGSFMGFSNKTVQTEFDQRVTKGVVKATYRQY